MLDKFYFTNLAKNKKMNFTCYLKVADVNNTITNNHNSNGGILSWPIVKTTDKDACTISPIDCVQLQIVGMCMFFLCVASIFSNGTLLRMFFMYKHIKLPANTFVIALTILNLFGSTFQMPFVVVSNVLCRYICDSTNHIMCFFK